MVCRMEVSAKLLEDKYQPKMRDHGRQYIMEMSMMVVPVG